MDSYQPLPGNLNHPNQPQPASSQGNPPVSDQRAQFSFRIKEIETSFENGCLYYYKILIMILAIISFVCIYKSFLAVCFVFLGHISFELDERFLIFGPLFGFTVFAYQKKLEYFAIHDKNLESANKAKRLILWLTVCVFVYIALLLELSDFEDQDVDFYVVIISASVLALLISSIGSWKVQALLQEREKLMKKLAPHGWFLG